MRLGAHEVAGRLPRAISKKLGRSHFAWQSRPCTRARSVVWLGSAMLGFQLSET